MPRVHRGRIPEDGFVTVVATNPHERELSADFTIVFARSSCRLGGEQLQRRREAVRPLWAPAVSPISSGLIQSKPQR